MAAGTSEPMVKSFAFVGSGKSSTLSPSDMVKHYKIPTTLTGAGQTIAIIDAPGSVPFPQMVTDLNTFSNYYSLPIQTSTNTIVTHIDLSSGTSPIPRSSNDWFGERALDVEWAHAIAPQAKIILVTAKSNSWADMIAAVSKAAAQPGVTAISLSWGGAEYSGETGAAYDGVLKSIQAQGIVVFASSGDSGDFGNYSNWPSVSPYVTSVGGTQIDVTAALAPTLTGEVVWSGSGGGTSYYEPLPSYQNLTTVGTTDITLDTGKKRLVPDVAYNADNMFSPVGLIINSGWFVAGGTSAGAPQWAAIATLIAQNRANLKKTSLQTLIASTPNGFNGLMYQTKLDQAALFDIQKGNDNTSGKTCALCNAGTGYDAATGLGVPNVNALLAFF